MAGRPTKLTAKLREAICQSLRVGNYVETAAAANGISKDTLYRWLKRGAREKQRLDKSKKARPKKAERPYVLFSDAVKKAEAIAETRDVANIGLASKDQWQASAWRLERKYPKRWGRKQQLEHVGEGGGPIKSEKKVGLSDEVAQEFAKKLLGIDL